MLGDARLDPVLDVRGLDVALGGILEGDVSARPFFASNGDADDGGIGDGVVFEECRF